MTIQIGLLVFPRVQQLDVIAPYEVFAYLPDTKMHLVWKTLEPVSSITGLVLAPTITNQSENRLRLVLYSAPRYMGGMVWDGRTLDHKTLEEIRRMAVERVREGEAPSAVIASYGFCRTTIYKWLAKVRRGGRGDPLRSRKGTGRPSKLTAKQKRQVLGWINGKDPRQYGFDFGLWPRQIVAELIAERFGVDLSLVSVGKLLAELGLTPQKPLQRAYERDPAAIDGRSIRSWQHGRNARGRRSISGMSPGSAPMPCKARRGA
jgi:transposase